MVIGAVQGEEGSSDAGENAYKVPNRASATPARITGFPV